MQKTLELARIEGGGTLNLQSVQLKNFVQHKILPQYLFAEHKLKMKIDLSSEFVLADTTALNIIFRNIIDNAIKYSASQPTEITFHGSVPKNAGDPFYLLNITHHHSNFNGDSRELGSLFYRGTNSQGAGVGLYLIQTLMKKMKGSATFSPSDQKFQTQLSFDLDRNSEATPEGGIS